MKGGGHRASSPGSHPSFCPFFWFFGAPAHEAHAAATQADAVFFDGNFYTANPRQPWATAVAIRGDRILYVGRGRSCRVRRARDRAVPIGRQTRSTRADRCAHPSGYGRLVDRMTYRSTMRKPETRADAGDREDGREPSRSSSLAGRVLAQRTGSAKKARTSAISTASSRRGRSSCTIGGGTASGPIPRHWRWLVWGATPRT